MKSFREYILEEASKPEGNYVALKYADINDFPIPDTKTGSAVLPDKRHVTLMYSKESSVCPKMVENYMLKNHPVDSLTAIATKAELLDDIPKEGERDENKGTIVLKLHSSQLNKMHEDLKTLGLKHSYDEFSPHVSLVYGVDRDEGLRHVEYLNSLGMFPHLVNLTGIQSEVIKTNASKSLVAESC